MIKLLSLLVLLSSFGAFAAPRTVPTPFKDVPAGTIVVKEKERALYFVMGETSIRYPVAVPKSGMEWSGYGRIDGKHWKPAWSPPAVVKKDHPELPNYIRGGAPNNPMGDAALTLDRDQLAIHGTSPSSRSSIGTAASYGCIRMLNEDIKDLYRRVRVGTVVLMRR